MKINLTHKAKTIKYMQMVDKYMERNGPSLFFSEFDFI